MFAWVLGLGTLALVAVLAYRGTRVEITQTDLEDGSALNALELEALEVRIELASADAAKSAALHFDGEEVEEPDIEIDGEVILWKPPDDLQEGEHELKLTAPRVLLSPAEFVWGFEIDTTPPGIDVPGVAEPVSIDESVVVTGTIEEGADLESNAGEATVDDDGNARIEFVRPPGGPVALKAVDRAGNSSASEVIIPVSYPKTRSVEVTAAAWSDQRLRGEILQLADQGRIDAVHLGLKDETGVVGFDTTVDQASQIGAVTPYVRLDDAVEALHERGVRVIGRVATFRDPVLAGNAWGAGRRDQVIQDSAGQPYGSSAQFTNFAHPAVQEYNLDIALDAVGRGVDEIVWDEIRRPGADIVIPTWDEPTGEALAGFLARTHDELRRRGAYQGVYAQGLSVIQSETVGQDVAQMARHADYVVPVIHPAYWGAGMFEVANPVGQPGELVAGALAAFQELTDPSGTSLMPSLQDRSVGYGEGQVRAQIQAARAAGVDQFVLSSPSSSYTASALDPR